MSRFSGARCWTSQAYPVRPRCSSCGPTASRVSPAMPKSRRLPSGAGHDAMVMSRITDMGMLFVRCGNGGISHHPSETLSADDADLAARAFKDFLLNFPVSHMTSALETSRSARSLTRDVSPPNATSWPKLVKTPTDNPPGDCAAHAERARASAGSHGVDRRSSSGAARFCAGSGMISATNLIVRQRFGNGGPCIALNAHGDVVPPGLGWTRDPYGAQIVERSDARTDHVRPRGRREQV